MAFLLTRTKKKRWKAEVKYHYGLRGLNLLATFVTERLPIMSVQKAVQLALWRVTSRGRYQSQGGKSHAKRQPEMAWEACWDAIDRIWHWVLYVHVRTNPDTSSHWVALWTVISSTWGPQEEPVLGCFWFYTCSFELLVVNPEKWTHPAGALAFDSGTLIRGPCGDMGGDDQWETMEITQRTQERTEWHEWCRQGYSM